MYYAKFLETRIKIKSVENTTQKKEKLVSA